MIEIILTSLIFTWIIAGIFFLARIILCVEINKQLSEWVKESIGTTDFRERMDAYWRFSPWEFAYRRVNIWTFEKAVEWLKKPK